MNTKIYITVVIVVLMNLSCKEIQGPAGPPGPPGMGLESLTDPSIMPGILSTYPPANSVGPYYSNWLYYDRTANQIQVRFNKVMDRKSIIKAVKLFSDSAKLASEIGLGVNAGHDLNLENLKFFKKNVPNLMEVSIGHALISDSIYFGLENTVQLYLRQLK